MTALPQPDLSRAVLIGTSVFDRLSDLPAVRNNLTELSRSLTDPDSGILPRDNCSIVDSPETTSRFMRRLRSVAQQTEDFLLVYYSGHGLRHEKRDLLYLAVQDTDPDVPEGTAVRFDSVREIIENSPARTRLLILDCCYSGLALGAMSSGTVDPRDVEVGGTAVITSSPRNKISHSPPGEQFTAFTGELITLLRNGSRIPDEPLTVGTAFRSLRAALAGRDLPEPKLRVTDTGSDMLLRRPTIHVKPKPAPEPEPAARPALKPELRVITKVRPLPRLPEPHSPPQPQPAAASTPRTVPTMTPVVPQLPPVQLKGQPNSITAKMLTSALADIGWFLSWLACCLSSGYGIGGIVGVIAESTADQHFGTDLECAIIGSAVALVGWSAIRWRLKSTRKRGRRSPSLMPRMPTWVVITEGSICAFIVLVSLTALSTSSSSSSAAGQVDVSSLTVNVSMEFFFSTGIAICGLELYRRRSRAVSGELSSNSTRHSRVHG